MSKYTVEQVESLARWVAQYALANQALTAVPDMLREYASLLRELESAKAAVTDEMVRKVYDIITEHLDGYGGDLLKGVGAALEAVAPMLASARVPEGWTDRHSSVQRFALRRFASSARYLAEESAQDQKKRHFEPDATCGFLADAKTAEECLAMFSAATKPVEMNGWSPIESAPQGEDVLTWAETIIPYAIECMDKNGNWERNDPKPTHWMPIPKGPKPETEE